MSGLNIQNSRIQMKYSTISGETPTIAPSGDHTDGTWSATDIYVGELFFNVTDENAWWRSVHGIVPLTSGATYLSTYLNITGGTMLGPIYGPMISATTISSPNFNGTFIGDGSGLTGLTNTNWTGGTISGPTTFTNTVDMCSAALSASTISGCGGELGIIGNLNIIGDISGTTFYGDGSGLTNLPYLSGVTLDEVLNIGDMSTNNNITLVNGDITLINGTFTGDGSGLTNLPPSNIPTLDQVLLVGDTSTSNDINLINGNINVTNGTITSNNINITSGGTTSKLGINTSTPEYTIDTYASDNSRMFYRDSLGGQLLISGSTGLPRMGVGVGVSGPNSYSSLEYGVRAWDDVTYPNYGQQGDAFIYAGVYTNGLNIISSDGDTFGGSGEDYIRFYAGRSTGANSSNVPDLHIDGSGFNRGYVGINNANPQSRLHVSGNTRIDGQLRVTDIPSGTIVGNLGYDSNGNIIQGTSGGTQSLTQTLAVGNETLGQDIKLTIGDKFYLSPSGTTGSVNKIETIDNTNDNFTSRITANFYDPSLSGYWSVNKVDIDNVMGLSTESNEVNDPGTYGESNYTYNSLGKQGFNFYHKNNVTNGVAWLYSKNEGYTPGSGGEPNYGVSIWKHVGNVIEVEKSRDLIVTASTSSLMWRSLSWAQGRVTQVELHVFGKHKTDRSFMYTSTIKFAVGWDDFKLPYMLGSEIVEEFTNMTNVSYSITLDTTYNDGRVLFTLINNESFDIDFSVKSVERTKEPLT